MIEEQHIQALRAKHAALEVAINEEIERPLPDSMALAKLKRQKLKIKEEIEQIQDAD